MQINKDGTMHNSSIDLIARSDDVNNHSDLMKAAGIQRTKQNNCIIDVFKDPVNNPDIKRMRQVFPLHVFGTEIFGLKTAAFEHLIPGSVFFYHAATKLSQSTCFLVKQCVIGASPKVLCAFLFGLRTMSEIKNVLRLSRRVVYSILLK
ncbi:hypothetical protein K1T71_013162 [Dendrolimus kikuchii]|uniref:Uncharacterized protein n=1 Tax=Dendrolimus kikuchii TaxID=765133 RepID=A0ACC1CJD9_9NEOP|nr:hypothetical protein K1T71_013162 [Dendrolimus kikuchii]